MPSNIPSKSDENGAAEFIKHQKLCDLDYYSHFSCEELETNPAYAFYTSKNMNIAVIIALLIHIGALLLHVAFIAFSVSDGFYLGFLRRQKETVEELLTINETK